jgi:HAD superfamily hydrolase (TIGR01458 family)
MTPIAGVLLDIQGTLLDASNRAFPGAADTVAALKRDGLAVRYVTNIDSVGTGAILARLVEAGIPAALEEVFSPIVALRCFLCSQPHAACRFLLPEGLADEVSAYAVAANREPDFVVVGDLKAGFTYERLNSALRDLLAGARLVALNKGRYYLEPGGAVLDTGAFAAALEHAASTEAYVIGKPSTELLRLALANMGVPGGDAVMVGDDAAADVGGGHAVGARTILVRTGKFTREALASAGIAPDLVVDSIADVCGAVRQLAG